MSFRASASYRPLSAFCEWKSLIHRNPSFCEWKRRVHLALKFSVCTSPDRWHFYIAFTIWFILQVALPSDFKNQIERKENRIICKGHFNSGIYTVSRLIVLSVRVLLPNAWFILRQKQFVIGIVNKPLTIFNLASRAYNSIQKSAHVWVKVI